MLRRTAGMATSTPTAGNNASLSLLDIINPTSVAALKSMIDTSPGHTYIKRDLSDVNVLKVFILDGSDDSVVSQMEMATNDKAAIYKRAMYGRQATE